MSEYNIIIASDDEHEKAFAEIYYREKFVALASQEGGLNRLEIEFPLFDVDEAMIIRTLELTGFQQALNSAAIRLAGEAK